MPLKAIIASQQEWASRQWLGHKSQLAPSLDANLIVPMPSTVRDQFNDGSGSELGSHGQPFSLRSSSALAYNFFAPWLGHDLHPLAAALGYQINDHTMQFERKFPHGLLKTNGLPSTPPNVDVTLDNEQSRPIGIECKFTEPYGPKKSHPPLNAKYFAGSRSRWTEMGMPQCQALAESVGKDVEFKRLGVGQLLKHLLGLAWTTKQPPCLVCLWFDAGCEEAREHRAELDRFSNYLGGVVEFRALSYQEAFAALRNGPEPISGYFDYLASRYFSA